MRPAAQAAGDTARATQDIRQSVERGTAATQQCAGQLNSAVGAASNLVKTLGGLYVVNQAVDKLSELPKIGVASAANMEVMQLPGWPARSRRWCRVSVRLAGVRLGASLGGFKVSSPERYTALLHVRSSRCSSECRLQSLRDDRRRPN